MQGESYSDIRRAARPSQHFSFGQISPKFYQDQPAANLLEKEKKKKSKLIDLAVYDNNKKNEDADDES